MRYSQYLEDQRKAKVETEKTRKRKALVDELQGVERKKVNQDTIETMTKEADELAKKAENKHDFGLLSRSNAFREKVADKVEEDKKLQAELNKLHEQIKNME